MADLKPLTDDDIREHLRLRAIEGFDGDAEIVASAIELLADGRGESADVGERVLRLAPEVFAAQALAEQAWPVPTDCDRLDRAFAALERSGVVARQHFACCQTCGHAEIGDEVDSSAGPVHGYAFFHKQDTEHAAEGHGLCVAYGPVVPRGTSKAEFDLAAMDVGREIVAALEREGLSPFWSGEIGRRIELPLTWRRRRRA
jgi:hypothetical protein